MRNPLFLAVLAALAGCAGNAPPKPLVTLDVAWPPIDAGQTKQGFIYTVPDAKAEADGVAGQSWAMLGREDRNAILSASGYTAMPCEPLPGGASGWDGVLDAIAAQAANHRIVIINENHSVPDDREFIRRLLPRLRPLGFDVYAAETFHNGVGKNPIETHAGLAWPSQDDGYYSREPSFGRLLRDARRLGFRFVAYEQIYDPAAPGPEKRDESIRLRETEQAQHLARIVSAMAPDERLVIHVGFSHALEVPIKEDDGQETTWMAARLKAATGIDPLTISQTTCRSAGGVPFLAAAPADVGKDWFDLIVSKPVETIVHHRPAWRARAGDIEVPIPPALRPTDRPLILEAFAEGEPFDAVPVDRVHVQPGEDVPLMLPPGRYTLRAVVPPRN